MSKFAPNANDFCERATKWIRWIARVWGTLTIAVTPLIVIGSAWNWVITGKANPYAAEDYPAIEKRWFFIPTDGRHSRRT